MEGRVTIKRQPGRRGKPRGKNKEEEDEEEEEGFEQATCFSHRSSPPPVFFLVLNCADHPLGAGALLPHGE